MDTQIDFLLHHLHGRLLVVFIQQDSKACITFSAEAEVYACSAGTSDALLMARLVRWLTNKPTTVLLFTDSSGARGIIQRQGVGRLRHLSCRILWLQALVQSGAVKLGTVPGSHKNLQT